MRVQSIGSDQIEKSVETYRKDATKATQGEDQFRKKAQMAGKQHEINTLNDEVKQLVSDDELDGYCGGHVGALDEESRQRAEPSGAGGYDDGGYEPVKWIILW